VSLRPFTIPEILAELAPAISEAELASIGRVSQAIEHAMKCAEELPATLDAHARALIIDKLHEAEHWCIELVRVQVQVNR
jgi:hypothetical protein